MAIASDISAFPTLGTSPFSSNILAFEHTPTNVPTVSKKSTNKKVKITVTKLFILFKFNIYEKSILPAILFILSNFIIPCGTVIPSEAAVSLLKYAYTHAMAAETMIPHKIEPLTLRLSKIVIRIKPPKVMRTAGVTFPKATKVLSSATIIPPFIIPMKAMNKPIPPLTASFIFFGIALATASRILNNDSIINMIPSTNTAVKATCHETPF